MNSRERLLAVAAGTAPDHKPIIIWPDAGMRSDAAIVSIKRLGNAGHSSRAVLAEILSPLARAILEGRNLTRTLHDSPETGEQQLGELIDDTRREISLALEAGADGIFYRLQGAEPEHATPMEYGGHFLEQDRSLLESAASAPLNVLFVEGGPEVYLDFVSDLPANVLAWDSVKSGVDVRNVRAMRKGPLAAADPDADILFGHNFGHLAQWIEPAKEGAHV